MTHYPSHSKIYHIKSDSLTLESSKISKVSITTNTKKMLENSNPLSGLLGQYDSDSDHENVNGQESLKLDAKVDNFLQEINQIAPKPNTNNTHDVKQQQIAWQECFDESTGYPYYWNIETNAVTWEMPLEYKQWLTKSKTQTNINDTVVPTISGSDTDNKLAQNVSDKQQNTNVKVQQNAQVKVQPNRQKHRKKVVKKKAFEDSASSDEEKIVMITSFSEGSSSESENETPQKDIQEEKKIENSPQNKVILGPYIEDIPKQPDLPEPKKEIIENVKDENIDETVILARLRTQAKVLHELGGELPKSVDKAILSEKLENKPQSLCLVAGYGDDSDHSEAEDETLFKKTIFPIPEIKESNENKQTESMLFPVTVPIDLKQFEISENTKQIVEAKDQNEELIDNKAFKRKKRLGLTFDVNVNINKKTRIDENEELILGESRKGFGFQASNENTLNVKKTGIAFIKADVLNESSNHSDVTHEDFTEIKNIVTEKVNFLGEGKDPVSAVQTMLIQLQTLEAAYNVQALTKTYLYSWLRETSTGLEKLEQEAAPEGWTCQWDRSHKRYFYRNTASGETQWHYPELEAGDPDIVGGGEAMDICTTPPPNEDPPPQGQPDATTRKGNERLRTPSPPRIEDSPSSTPPPPTNDVQPPIPTAPPPDETIPPPPPTITENQPLPPGVDTSDLPYFAAKLKELSSKNDATNKDSLGSELDSFYSDIAQLEASSSQSSIPEVHETKSVSSPSSVGVGENPADIIVKKKKKSKKMGQGINMKKKAVSSLVEKWKKVQNDY